MSWTVKYEILNIMKININKYKKILIFTLLYNEYLPEIAMLKIKYSINN